MNSVTLVYSYYNTPEVIPLLLNNWMSWSSEARENIKIIVIDDGSDRKFYEEFKNIYSGGLNIEIYEIIENIKWNQPGAFNLGISISGTK